MSRSQAMRSVRDGAPSLARPLAGQWANGFTVVWHRTESAWLQSHARRGGFQGSRLAQLAFNLDVV
eukprot:6846931-Lingulodinium_polyedra.AAC.1